MGRWSLRWSNQLPNSLSWNKVLLLFWEAKFTAVVMSFNCLLCPALMERMQNWCQWWGCKIIRGCKLDKILTTFHDAQTKNSMQRPLQNYYGSFHNVLNLIFGSKIWWNTTKLIFYQIIWYKPNFWMALMSSIVVHTPKTVHLITMLAKPKCELF